MDKKHEGNGSGTAEPAYLHDKEFQKAVKGRLEEFSKFKRDIQSRYTETLGMTTTRMAKMRLQQAELEKVQHFAEQALAELGQVEPESWPEDKFTAELAQAMRKLENCRLELIRHNARLDEIFISGEENDRKEQKTSPILDLMSLSFGQLLRLGMIVTLPVALVLGLGLAVIAVAVYFSTRV